MIMRSSPLRAISFKTILILLFILLPFFTFSNSYADKLYKVKNNDFLGKIVKRNYSLNRDITKEQVMVAILRANPEAFRGGNIHFLKKVDSLLLPSTETVALISPSEALQTINKHYTFFKRNKTGNFPPIKLKRPSKNEDNGESSNKKIDAKTITSENTTSTKIENKQDKTVKADTTNTDTTALEGLSTLSELTQDEIVEADTTNTDTTALEGLSTLSELTQDEAVEADTTNTDTTALEGLSTLSELTQDEAVVEADTTNTDTTTSDGFSTLSELTENTQKATSDTEASSEMSSLASLSTLAELETDNIEENLEQQQQAAALKNEQIQELEKRKEEQNVTLNQLDNQIKELEENLTNPSKNKNDETISPEITAATPDNTTSPLFLLLLLPIFVLFGILWWRKKSKKPSTASTKDQTIDNKPVAHQPLHTQQTSPKIQRTAVKTSIEKSNHNNETPSSTRVTDKNVDGNNKEETAIKLDMAKAYQDMGYPEEAKEILEEVIREGTTQQKEMAEGLLAVL